MNRDEIKDIYDTNLNITLSELSKISGKSIKELKTILMESRKWISIIKSQSKNLLKKIQGLNPKKQN